MFHCLTTACVMSVRPALLLLLPTHRSLDSLSLIQRTLESAVPAVVPPPAHAVVSGVREQIRRRGCKSKEWAENKKKKEKKSKKKRISRQVVQKLDQRHRNGSLMLHNRPSLWS